MSENKLSQLRDQMKGATPKREKSVLQQALEGYWDRQGRMAQGGLQMADQGAQAVRGGDLSGLAGMVLGPLGYLASPVNALFPERTEVDAAGDVPSWSKPLIAGGLETMAIMAPGPKGKGLGRGMAQLADDVTDAERAAAMARFEAEVGQTGTGAVPASRDQALRNLTEAPPKPKRGQIETQSYKETSPDGTTRWVPGTLRVNPPKQVFEPEMSPADMQRLGIADMPPRKKGEIVTQSYKETYPDGTTRWVPGTLRSKTKAHNR